MKKSIPALFLLLIISCNQGNSVSAYVIPPRAVPLERWNLLQAGLLFPEGIEPGVASQGEAPAGNRNWYVDAQASDGGDGSYETPFNSFEEVAGYVDSSGGYVAGLIRGGDYLYVKGVFRASEHIEGVHNMDIHLARDFQGGTAENPTVIKSWLGEPRAIFDGEFLKQDLIHIRWFDEQKILIQNIEVTRAQSRGIYIGERTAMAEIVSVEVHHGSGDGHLGVGGGIMLRMQDVHSTFEVRNCLIHNNYQNQIGGNGNVGGLSILSEGWAPDGSSVEIHHNVIFNERNAIRHKHSGNITMNAHHNWLSDSENAFLLRAFFNNKVHHNLMENCSSYAIILEQENLQGEFMAEIENNTIINCLGAVGSRTDGSVPYEMHGIFRNNLYYSPDYDTAIALGRWSSNLFDLANWTAGNNLYWTSGTGDFLYNQGMAYSYQEAMAVLNEENSLQQEPQFLAFSQGNYQLADGSPGTAMGSDGNNLGAWE